MVTPNLKSSGHDRLPADAAPESRSLSSYAAPGDEPLFIPSTITLNEPFRFDRGLAKRIRQREVNAKEAFTLRDAAGTFYRASLREYDAKGGIALPYERMTRSPESTIDIVLACAVLARHRMQFIVEKATELGVRRIVPLLTDHAVPQAELEREQAHAWAGHILRATKQCRRSSLPYLLTPATLDAFVASPLFAATELRLFLDDRVDLEPLPADSVRRVILLVGPEGGFSDAERERLSGVARPFVIGGRVLRAETAAIAGLATVHTRWGDFR